MYLQSNKISHINTGQHMKNNHSFNKKNIQFSKEILQKLKCDNQKCQILASNKVKRGYIFGRSPVILIPYVGLFLLTALKRHKGHLCFCELLYVYKIKLS